MAPLSASTRSRSRTRAPAALLPGRMDGCSSPPSMQALSAKSFPHRTRHTVAVERISYQAGGKTFIGALVYDETVAGRRPLLLMAPNWLGVGEDAIERTRKMAGQRYIGFVADMYGEGKVSA